MLNNNFASQSTEARNSAVVNFSNNSSYSNKIEIPVRGFSRDSIITWVGEAVEVERKDVRFCGWIEGGKSIEVHLTKDYFSKNYNVDYTIFDDGKVNMEKSGSIDLDFKVLKGTNINKAVWAITRALEELPYYFVTSIDSNEIEAIEDAEISEAPVLDEAPCLEEDDITEEGYSVAGLAYVRENTSEVYMDDIIKEVAEFHWDFESVVKESRWTRFTNDSFRELIWSTCWSEYLVAHTDEALEAETRYVMCFDSTYDDLFYELWPYMTSYDDSCGGCELWVDSWYAVERAAEIIEETATNYVHTRCICWDEFPDYMMTAFLGDLYGFETFTERVMSELEGGDIVDILPYDDGLYLSFVGDEAEVAA